MFGRWKLGTAFGIGIYIHWTFLLLLAWVGWESTTNAPPQMAVWMLGLTLAVFGCVVLHELGHALMARRFGIATRDITLYPIGGVARLERMSERPIEELLIALAGPAVNLVIAFLLFACLSILEPFAFEDFLPGFHGESFLGALMKINITLVLFNLIPAFPMDGGRVLRAILATRLGLVRATQIAAWLGGALALAFVMLGSGLVGPVRVFGLELGGPMMLLIGMFVYFAGQQELAVVVRRDQQRRWGGGYTPWVRPAEMFVNQGGFSGYTWDGQAGTWTVWRDGRPIGTMPME
jgi:Zn-dependent protease